MDSASVRQLPGKPAAGTGPACLPKGPTSSHVPGFAAGAFRENRNSRMPCGRALRLQGWLQHIQWWTALRGLSRRRHVQRCSSRLKVTGSLGSLADGGELDGGRQHSKRRRVCRSQDIPYTSWLAARHASARQPT